MKKQLNLVTEFHKKFDVPIADSPTLIPEDRSTLRHDMIEEEIKEYSEGVRNKDLENISKELTDILYATYGAILEHGLQDRFEKIFEEVHRSNMSKSYHKYKVQKGDNFSPANLKDILK
jgi:predicted HAD superfamily Cof-like phosphohydrolase